jgi:SAM-dependent methyltransferase
VLELTEFVLSHLPPAPARVLEVGCGDGELTRALADAGHEVTGIDPNAPAGPLFRRIRLEDVDGDERYDAVVAARAFHHMGANLELNLEHVARLLDGGPFVLDEFGWERLDEPTADWYDRQRRALRAAGHDPHGPEASEWREHHEGHGALPSDELLAAVRARFDETHFEWLPYLWRHLGGVSSRALEESLVAAGAVQPLGFRFVGMPRLVRPL